MLQPLFDSTVVPLLEKVAAFGERRQEVLAGNIANIDTPEYRRRDLPVAEFQKALKEAVAAPVRNAGESTRDERFPGELFRAIEPEPANIVFQDGSDRSIEHEVMEMTRNAMMQSFAVELLAAQLRMLEAAVSERA
ncbi:MAG: hypothetical protein WD069_15195 [Planctomycetales bacterium]